MSDETTEVERLRARLVSEEAATAEATRLMTLWQEREGRAVAEAERLRANVDQKITDYAEAAVQIVRLRGELADGREAMEFAKRIVDAHNEGAKRHEAALATERAARERAERERDEALAAAGMNRLALAKRAERLESALREIAGGEVWDGSVVHVVPPRVRQYAHRATLSPPVEAGVKRCPYVDCGGTCSGACGLAAHQPEPKR